MTARYACGTCGSRSMYVTSLTEDRRWKVTCKNGHEVVPDGATTIAFDVDPPDPWPPPSLTVVTDDAFLRRFVVEAADGTPLGVQEAFGAGTVYLPAVPSGGRLRVGTFYGPTPSTAVDDAARVGGRRYRPVYVSGARIGWGCADCGVLVVDRDVHDADHDERDADRARTVSPPQYGPTAPGGGT